jgi:hypothetical protein
MKWGMYDPDGLMVTYLGCGFIAGLCASVAVILLVFFAGRCAP